MERSGLIFEHFCSKIVKNRRAKKSFFLLILPYKTLWKLRFPMDQRPLVEGRIANLGISLDLLSSCVLDDFLLFFKKIGFQGILSPPGNHASQCIRDFWSKGVLLIWAYLQTFLSFCVLFDFFRFSKKSGFGVFLIHPPMASVLLSALVERCFVSRMRDFFWKCWPNLC